MLVLLTACALLVRLWASAQASAYVDEALTYYVAAQGPAGILTACKGDYILPGFYLPLWPVAAVTDARLWLRLPSSLCGALCPALLVQIGRRLGHERAGWAAGWLYAVAYPVVLAEAQIRLYGLLDLLILLSVWLWLERRNLLAVLLVLPWIHVMGTAATAAWAAVGIARRDRALLGGAVGSLLLFCPWLLYTFSGPTAYFLRQNRPRPGLGQMVEAAGYLTGLPALGGGATAVLVLGLGVLLAVAWGLRRLPERGVLLLILAAPLAPALLAALRGTQEFQARYLVPVAALTYLAGYAALPRRVLPPVGVALVAVNLWLSLTFPLDSRLMNQDWDSAARFISSLSKPGDVIAAYTPYSLLGLNYAYAGGSCYLNLELPGRLDIRYRPEYAGLEQIPLTPAFLGPELQARLERHPQVFLVLNQEGPEGAAVRGWFGERFGILRELQTSSLYSWGEIYVYLLKPRYARTSSEPPPGTAPASVAPR